MGNAEGAVARKDDDNEDISYGAASSGTLSRAATVARARDKSSALKAVKADYAQRLGQILFGSFFGARWGPTCSAFTWGRATRAV
jgi:hypothetical protein